MRSVMILLALAGLSGCAASPDFTDANVLNNTMTFNWNTADPCVLDSITVGSNYACDDSSHPDYDDACVGRGKTVVVRSNPAGAAFKMYFSPYQNPKRVPGTSSRLRINSDTPVATYKYTVVRELRACENRPIDPHIRVRDTETDATMGGQRGPQAPPAPPEPPGPVTDPD